MSDDGDEGIIKAVGLGEKNTAFRLRQLGFKLSLTSFVNMG